MAEPILPEVVLSDGPRRVTAPNMRWRILAGPGSDTRFDSQAARDQAAREIANESSQGVICEFWDWSNPQDPLNEGWASDGTIYPDVYGKAQPATGKQMCEGITFVRKVQDDGRELFRCDRCGRVNRTTRAHQVPGATTASHDATMGTLWAHARTPDE